MFHLEAIFRSGENSNVIIRLALSSKAIINSSCNAVSKVNAAKYKQLRKSQREDQQRQPNDAGAQMKAKVVVMVEVMVAVTLLRLPGEPESQSEVRRQ